MSPYPFFVTKIGSSSSWHKVDIAVVFFKSLIGTILGISISLWDYFTTTFYILSIKKADLTHRSKIQTSLIWPDFYSSIFSFIDFHFSIVACIALIYFAFSSIFFAILFTKESDIYFWWWKNIFEIWNICFFYYCTVIFSDINIFYGTRFNIRLCSFTIL